MDKFGYINRIQEIQGTVAVLLGYYDKDCIEQLSTAECRRYYYEIVKRRKKHETG